MPSKQLSDTVSRVTKEWTLLTLTADVLQELKVEDTKRVFNDTDWEIVYAALRKAFEEGSKQNG